MKVSELIGNLEKMPPTDDVVIAFDMGIRMNVEVAELVNNDGEQVCVLTDKDEWNDRQHW